MAFGGNLTTGTLEKFILLIVMTVALFKVGAALIPEGQAAGDELNASGVPLGSFFTGDGIVWLLVMVGILIVVIRNYMSKGKYIFLKLEKLQKNLYTFLFFYFLEGA